MIVPASWTGVLEMFRPVFRRRGTFMLFTVLATGMVTQTGRRSVVGMLSGARMAGGGLVSCRVPVLSTRCGMSSSGG